MMGNDNFDRAYGRMRAWEGGYANHPNDRGGETYAGVSRRAWPNWEGWRIIDEEMGDAANIAELNKALATNERLQRAIADFYFVNFWKPVWNGMHGVQADQLQRKMFDTAVNVGIRPARRFLQQALNASMGGVPSLIVDGILGPKSRERLQAFLLGGDEAMLVAAYCEVQAEYYRQIVARDPSQEVFLGGWLRRAADMCEVK